MIYVGIDNGVTGTIGILSDNHRISMFVKTPTKKVLDYTKKKSFLTRIDTQRLVSIFDQLPSKPLVLLERPMVNSKMFKSTISAVRALEATINVLEILEIPYEYIDSKEWQKHILPSGIKGRDELKLASQSVGLRLFPEHSELINKNKDADGILIAHYCLKTRK